MTDIDVAGDAGGLQPISPQIREDLAELGYTVTAVDPADVCKGFTVKLLADLIGIGPTEDMAWSMAADDCARRNVA